MTVPVARRNLFAEKARFAISVGGVAFAVLLILIVLALYRGWSRTGEVFEQLPGELWVVQHGTSDPFHSVSLLEPRDLELAQETEGVEGVIPVLSRQMNIHLEGGGEESVRFMALGFPEGYPIDDELRERFVPGPGEVIIEKILSRQTGLVTGDALDVTPVSLTVVDVRPKGGDVLSQFAFLNFGDASAIFGVGDAVNYGMVSVAEDASVDTVRTSIEEQSARLQVDTSEGFAEAVRKEIDESFIPVILILVAIGFVVGSAVVGLTIYTATIERSREFGVMKAVGASPAFLYRIVLSQSAMLTAGGFVMGLLAAVGTADLAARAVPEFSTEFRASDVGFVFVAAALMALFASFVPVKRIVNIDPAMVFRA